MSTLNDMKNGTMPRRLSRITDFRRFGARTVETVRVAFNRILDMTIEEMHSIARSPTVTPFMLGITYIHQLAHRTQHLDPTGEHVGHIFLLQQQRYTNNMREIELVWRNQSLNDGPLTGVIFLPDALIEDSLWCKRLKDRGATQIGIEINAADPRNRSTRGAPYFVAKKMIVFAINNGLSPDFQRCADTHKLFTLSLKSQNSECYDATVTARSFADLKSVAAALEINVFRTYNRWDKLVVITFGWQTFQADQVLFNLALTLQNQGYPVLFFFEHQRFEAEVVETAFRDEASYNKIFPHKTFHQREDVFNPEQERVLENVPWSFVIASWVRLEYNVLADPHSEAAMITIPVDESANSIRIVRRYGAVMHLMDFAADVCQAMDI